jgi:hypothetical protein
MTPHARSFDLYLLSQMRSATATQGALKALDADAAEVEEAVALITAAGFADAVVFTQQYIDMLGAPYRDETNDEGHVEYRFGAARRLRFRRPPWPDFDFTVGADQNRCVFGVGLLRSGGAPIPTLDSVADLSPWRFVRSEIVARFGTPRMEDEWSGWEDLSFEIPDEPNGEPRRYLLRFDYDLFQDYVLYE